MTETSDELRKRLKAEYATERTEPNISSDDTGNGDSPAVSATSRDIEQYAPNFTNTDGHSIQPVSRPGLGAISVGRAVSKSKRKPVNLFGGTSQGDLGDRHTARRFSENNGAGRPDGTNIPASDNIRSTRSIGGLTTDEPIPIRLFETESTDQISKVEDTGTSEPRKRGRPSTKGTFVPVNKPEIVKKERKIPAFLTGPTFSKQEAISLQEPLITALHDELALADKALWNITGDVLQQPIWSDISDKEMESLTNILLKLGQKSPAIATATRAAIDGSDYITAGVILAPRIGKTAQIVKQARLQRKVNSENSPKQSKISSIRNRRRQATQTSGGEGYRGV